MNKVFKYRLMSADVAYNRRRRTLILVPGSVSVDAGRRIPQICRHDAIMLKNDCAFRTGNFNPAWICWVGGRSRLENAERAAGEVEDCDCGVFSVSVMQSRRGARLDTTDVAQ